MAGDIVAYASTARKKDLAIGFSFTPYGHEVERFAETTATLLDIQRSYLAGQPFDTTRLPDRLYWDKHDVPPAKLPPVFSAGFLLLRSDVAEVFRDAGLGENELRPVALIDRDLETPLGETCHALVPQSGHATLDLSRVTAKRVWDNVDVFELPNALASAEDGDGTVLRARADLITDRPVWNDPSLWLTFFVSEPVGATLFQRRWGKSLHLFPVFA